MSDERKYRPGVFIVREAGEITLMDGETIRGAIIEFPAGTPDGMTWGDIWNGNAFTIARAVEHVSEPTT